MKCMRVFMVLIIAATVLFATGCDLMFLYFITASAGPHGGIDPDGMVTVPAGKNKTFDIIPDPGYSVEDVRVDGHSVGPVSRYTFLDVMENHEIYATFTDVINVAGSWGGPLTIEGEGGYELSAALDQSGTDIMGYASIWFSGVLLTEYDVDWTIGNTTIEGMLYGIGAGTYDIEVNAIVNSSGDEIDAYFHIPASDANGTFLLTRN